MFQKEFIKLKVNLTSNIMVIKKEKISFQALQKNGKLNKILKNKKEKYSTTKILKFKLKN